MLDQVYVKNYKCLRDVTVDLEPFTVFIGPNDTGKSSLLNCLAQIGKFSRSVPAADIAASFNELKSNANRKSTDSEVMVTAVARQPSNYRFEIAAGPANQFRQMLSLGRLELHVLSQIGGVVIDRW